MKNPEIMEHQYFDDSNNEIGMWSYQSEAEKYINYYTCFEIRLLYKWLKHRHNYLNIFPVISYDFPMAFPCEDKAEKPKPKEESTNPFTDAIDKLTDPIDKMLEPFGKNLGQKTA